MEAKKKNFLYSKIYQDLKNKINNSELKSGEKLKSEQELQEFYQASRDTIRKSLSLLELEGYIVRRAAVGTFVKRKKSDYLLSKMESFTEQMMQRGVIPSSELVSIELLSNVKREIQEELSLKKNDKCYKLCRIRKGDNEPMAYECAYIPQKLCPDLQIYINDKSSLYNIYENIYGFHLKLGKIKLEAELPSTEVQNNLHISKFSPILRMHCTQTLENDTPLYYVDCAYIGDKYVFTTVIPR